MKTLFKALCTVALVLCIGALYSSCKKGDGGVAPPPPPPPAGGGTASFALNGGGFSNQTFNLSNALAGFEEGSTGVVASTVSGTDTVSLFIGFPGNQPGTFAWSDTSGVIIIISSPSTTKGYGPYSGSTSVTTYGNVGGTVNGTFSGSLVGGIIGGTTVDTVTVSNGSFAATRVQ